MRCICGGETFSNKRVWIKGKSKKYRVKGLVCDNCDLLISHNIKIYYTHKK